MSIQERNKEENLILIGRRKFAHWKGTLIFPQCMLFSYKNKTYNLHRLNFSDTKKELKMKLIRLISSGRIQLYCLHFG